MKKPRVCEKCGAESLLEWKVRPELCRNCYSIERDAFYKEQDTLQQKELSRIEYRELVKQYAGQIIIGTIANSNVKPVIDLDLIVKNAHALAKAVLQSLKPEGKIET